MPRLRLRSLACGLVVVLLVLAPLIASRVFLFPLPQGDTWGTIEEFRHWTNGEMSLREVLGRHGPHPGVLVRPATFALLTHGSGDLSVLTIFSWIISVGSLLGLLLLLRQNQARGNSSSSFDWPLLIASAACVFSLSQSFSWFWEFLWVNWLPGACLALALPVMGARRMNPFLRWFLLIFLTTLAMVGFGNGIAVWIVLALGWGFQRLFVPPAESSLEAVPAFRPGWVAIAIWVIGWGALTLATFPDSDSDAAPQALPSLIARIGVAVPYFLYLMGSIIGKGTAAPTEIQGVVIGTFFFVLFLVGGWRLWCRRRDLEEVARLLPWFQLGCFSVLSGLMIAAGRLGNTLDSALASRYITLTLFLPLSAIALTWLTRKDPSREKPRRAVLSASLPFVAGGLAILLVASSFHGIREMRYHYFLRIGHAATLQFSRVLPDSAQREIFRWSEDMVGDAWFLEERDRLPVPRIFRPEEIADLKVLSPNKEASVHVHPDPENPSEVLAGGHARLNGLENAPDLILIVAVPGLVSDEEDFPALEAEQIVGMARPDLPEIFFFAGRYRHRHPELFYQWEAPLENERLPQGGPITLRAYAYDYRARMLRPFPKAVAIPTADSLTP